MRSILVILIFILLSLENRAYATNLRGQVVRYNPYNGTYYPLSGVRVDFWFWNGTDWVFLAYAVTGIDGFYYFNDVTPGYFFKVGVLGNFYPPQALTVINVVPPYFQDIPWVVT